MQAVQETSDRIAQLDERHLHVPRQKSQTRGDLDASLDLTVRAKRDADVTGVYALVLLRLCPSAMLDGIEIEARRNWLVNP
jgi:hypothetical protein